MKHHRFVVWLFVLGVALCFAQQASAQQWEVYGYGGGIFPSEYREQFDLKQQTIWGAKFLGYTSDRIGIEGNLGYISHFEFEDVDPKSRGLIWEVNTNFNFFGSRGSIARFAPYVTVGVGGVTARISDRSDLFEGQKRAIILAANHPLPPEPAEPEPPVIPIPNPPLVSPTALILEDGDTFFAVNFGGGLKRNKVWGPVGLRVDFLGRSMPNFFHNTLTWFEMTGGINVRWGER